VTSRRDARRLAIDILYQADVTGAPAADVVDRWADVRGPIPPFARELVSGVAENLGEIDVSLGAHAQEWTVSRMAALDRTILRVAVFELLHRPDVPPGAAISEAVEAAGELSGDDARRFVNGVLGTIADELEAEPRG